MQTHCVMSNARKSPRAHTGASGLRRPCRCILTRRPWFEGASPESYIHIRQRQCGRAQAHTHEQVQPGHAGHQPGFSGLPRPDRCAQAQNRVRLCSPSVTHTAPKQGPALTGTLLHNTQSRAVWSANTQRSQSRHTDPHAPSGASRGPQQQPPPPAQQRTAGHACPDSPSALPRACRSAQIHRGWRPVRAGEEGAHRVSTPMPNCSRPATNSLTGANEQRTADPRACAQWTGRHARTATGQPAGPPSAIQRSAGDDGHGPLLAGVCWPRG